MSTKSEQPANTPEPKPGLHPNNPHRFRYNFPQLIKDFPALEAFVRPNKYGDTSIDFTDPKAVKALNQALLSQHYGIAHWDIPAGYLCPPIPGRADYLHHIADHLASQAPDHKIPKGSQFRVLDIGVGANCIYPLIGHKTFGWSFVGTDVDPTSVKSAIQLVKANHLGKAIEIRQQKNAEHILLGISKPNERFDLSICNPPFFGSLEEALSGNRRKWKNLRKSPGQKPQPKLNFGGQAPEIWSLGGEKAFVLRMIRESRQVPQLATWFSCLVSKKSNLPALTNGLDAARVSQRFAIDMAQGQKVSRLLVWSYQ